jgi:ribosomal protein S18 acetylase RimI-like enzyme
LIAIRDALLKARPGAGRVRSAVLAPEHPYTYEMNIGRPNTLNHIAETDSSIIGFISVLLTRWNPNGQSLWERLAAYLAFVGVLPEHQGNGVGELLLRNAVNATAALSKEPLLFLEYGNGNGAERLYERVGFRKMTEAEVMATCGLLPKGPVMCLPLRLQ